MKDNFKLVGEDFAFCCMNGAGGLPAGVLVVDGKKMFEYPNIMDFPFSGKGKPSPSNLPPPCPEGYEGRHPNCRRIVDKKEFTGYSNQEGDDKSGGGSWSDKIDADTITSALETGKELISLFGKREFSEVETVCGKQPKPLIGGKAKKQAWAKCASDYMQSKLNKRDEKKGLSTGAWIGISAGAVVVVGAVVFLLTRKGGVKQQPQVIVQPAPAIAVAK